MIRWKMDELRSGRYKICTGCGNKSIPLLQTFKNCDHPAILCTRNRTETYLFQMTSTAFCLSRSVCRIASMSPHFDVFQSKLSMMSQNTSEWSVPLLCSVSSKFMSWNVCSSLIRSTSIWILPLVIKTIQNCRV